VGEVFPQEGEGVEGVSCVVRDGHFVRPHTAPGQQRGQVRERVFSHLQAYTEARVSNVVHI